jgi:hypothetical protein
VLIIFVGDTGNKTADYARSVFADAQLINDINFSSSSGVYYTSLGDFKNPISFFKLLDGATELFYVPVASWSDSQNGVSHLQQYTENLLMFFYGRKPVHGLEHLDYHNTKCDSLVGYRIHDVKQLWSVGGTITFSPELEIANKYGSVLSQLLDIPVCFITKDNADIDWCADQILRSDLKPNDIIVWELSHSQHIDQSLILINQVIQVCKNLNVKLVLIGLEDMDRIKYFFNLPNYLHLFGQFGTFSKAFLDKDSSTLWPGAMTHRWYANEIYKKFFQ